MSALIKMIDKSVDDCNAIERCIRQAWLSYQSPIADTAANELEAMQARIKTLEKQLSVAVHLKADDKEGFDWKVLGRIAELEELLYEFENNPNIDLGELGHEKIAAALNGEKK